MSAHVEKKKADFAHPVLRVEIKWSCSSVQYVSPNGNLGSLIHTHVHMYVQYKVVNKFFFLVFFLFGSWSNPVGEKRSFLLVGKIS